MLLLDLEPGPEHGNGYKASNGTCPIIPSLVALDCVYTRPCQAEEAEALLESESGSLLLQFPLLVKVGLKGLGLAYRDVRVSHIVLVTPLS